MEISTMVRLLPLNGTFDCDVAKCMYKYCGITGIQAHGDMELSIVWLNICTYTGSSIEIATIKWYALFSSTE